MRFLSVNNLRLGNSPGSIPAHIASDSRRFSARTAWQRAVSLATEEAVHAVLLSGQTLSPSNTGLEPWGPLTAGLAELQHHGIPVIAIPDGQFTPRNLTKFAPEYTIHWLENSLAWDPTFTTSMDPHHGQAVHIIAASLAESPDAPVNNPVTLHDIDHPDSIWLLTDSLQADAIQGEHALVIEPGSVAPLSAHETDRHGAWLIDTDTREAQLIPLASLEFASIDIDISSAEDLDNLERVVIENLVHHAISARQDSSIAQTTVADITLTGASRLYPALADTATELETMLVIEHDGMTIGISRIVIDATPLIDLEPLLNRPDPVGEVARLISALDSAQPLNDAQSRLLTSTEQKLLAISHARVFGTILDTEPDTDAPTLLRRQGWATLDALVRQRGID